MKSGLFFIRRAGMKKKSCDFLTKRGFEVFLPLQKMVRQWSDRKKKVEVPLFNSYLFVFSTEDKIPEILQTPGISWNIRHNDKPAVLRESEMALIQRFLSSGLFLETSAPDAFEIGDAVEVIDGSLRGLTGNIVRSSQGSKFSVALESIRHTIIVKLDPAVLRALK